jgi:hypothetical protein
VLVSVSELAKHGMEMSCPAYTTPTPIVFPSNSNVYMQYLSIPFPRPSHGSSACLIQTYKLNSLVYMPQTHPASTPLNTALKPVNSLLGIYPDACSQSQHKITPATNTTAANKNPLASSLDRRRRFSPSLPLPLLP